MTNSSASQSKVTELQGISQRILRCTKCHLSITRTRAVPGEGSPDARVMIVGEGPGRQEDLEGRPFVGRAGRFLDELLVSARTDRRSVYISNIVKCRASTKSSDQTLPQEQVRDRKPTGEEIVACAPYLEEQVELIEPQIVCTLGDTATRFVLEKYGLKIGNISRIHGRIFSAGGVKIIPMFHPAAALYRADLREVMVRDFRKLTGLLAQTTLVDNP